MKPDIESGANKQFDILHSNYERAQTPPQFHHRIVDSSLQLCSASIMEKYHLLSLNLNVEQNDPNKEKELFLTLSLLKADDMRYVFVKVSELDSIKEILRKVLNNIEGVDDFSMGF